MVRVFFMTTSVLRFRGAVVLSQFPCVQCTKLLYNASGTIEELFMHMEKRLIKKYPNRRLYDTAISGYITVNDVKQMIIEYAEVEVVDAKTGEDLTRQVLLQILLEEEAGGSPLLNNEILCQFIRMYGQATQSVFGPFLEQNMKLFSDWQKNLHDQTKNLTQHSAPWLSQMSQMHKNFNDNQQLWNQNLKEWQKSLQQQATRFWQSVGFMPKENSDSDPS